MVVYRDLHSIPPAPGGRAIALGTFDGVHMGHRRVIAAALEWARSNGAFAAVATFEPHPLEVLRPGDAPLLLTTTARKVGLIAELGVDEVIVIPFTERLSLLSPGDFCAEVLAGSIGARMVSVGANFQFGQGAAGDADTLRGRPEFETRPVALVEHGGDAVSSSRIRRLVAGGNVAAAAELLEAPFEFEGEVVRGDARGRELGMPTANVAPVPGMVVPAPGVYACTARGHAAAVNVGVRPTFGRGGRLLIEAHLIGFEGDLYGQSLRIGFLARLRDELRFDSPDELTRQMHRDAAQVAEVVAATAPTG